VRSGTPALLLAALTMASVLVVPVYAVPTGRPPPVPASADSIHPLFPTRISHVVVILFENSAASNTIAKGSFFRYLAGKYAYVTSDYAICHPSAPNYLALTSGATYSQCGSDNHHVYNATNIADELTSKGRTWDAFAESMPKACDVNDSYPYMVKHEPFVFYKDIVDNATRCDAHVLPLTSWTADVNSSSIPNYSFITPNMKDDGHDTNVSYASSWLHTFLTPLVNKTWFASTAFFITFDEGSTNTGAGSSSKGPTNSTGGGNIYLAIVGPTSLGVGNITGLSSQYSVMTTIEWLLGLPSTGHHDVGTSWPALKTAFT
jgi:phosphatidylinositol-3-phosphatase